MKKHVPSTPLSFQHDEAEHLLGVLINATILFRRESELHADNVFLSVLTADLLEAGEDFCAQIEKYLGSGKQTNAKEGIKTDE